MKSAIKLNCPKCGTRVKIDSLVLTQFEQSVRADLEKEYSRKESEYAKRLEKIRTEVREQTQQESYLKIRDKEKLISDLKTQLIKVREKLENSSQQLQGEVQELELESILKSTFPTDVIKEVPKGFSGADCSLHVTTSNGIEIGTILFESKRVKTFSESWITKLKKDNLKAKAQVTVLVTSTFPRSKENSTEKFYLHEEGVWICLFSPEAIKQLTLVLRYGLLKVFELTRMQKNSDTKSEKLYHFLTSPDFSRLMDDLLKGFDTLEQSFQDEKKKLETLFRFREQQLSSMLNSTLEFYSTIRGIASDNSESNMRKAG